MGEDTGPEHAHGEAERCAWGKISPFPHGLGMPLSGHIAPRHYVYMRALMLYAQHVLERARPFAAVKLEIGSISIKCVNRTPAQICYYVLNLQKKPILYA